MKKYGFMLINQLPITKLTEYDNSSIAMINDVITQRLNKYESYYVDGKIYIKPFPI
jgi:hypothetical protein